jgi:nucleotide-binding universal stress UspA family protein
MAPIRLMLVPSDFSAASTAAIEYATDLARRLDARLRLIHVFQIPVFAVPDTVVPVSPETAVSLREAVGQRLESERAQVEKSGVPATAQVLDGAPFVEIIRTARDLPADLIVMGTHGRTGLKHVLLGSVAEKVVRKAGCPVLVVRPPAGTFELP